MKSASLTHGAGPGSTITLTAETIRVRDAIIEKFADKSLAELNAFIETALGSEKDENKRLGILAARVYILRMRMQNIAAFNRDPSMQTLNEITPASLLKNRGGNADSTAEETPEGEAQAYEEWNELIVIEAGEINGVRIPKGVTITVGMEDARRLIETNKAVFAKSGSKEQPENPSAQAEHGNGVQTEPSAENAAQDEAETSPATQSLDPEEANVSQEEPSETKALDDEEKMSEKDSESESEPESSQSIVEQPETETSETDIAVTDSEDEQTDDTTPAR